MYSNPVSHLVPYGSTVNLNHTATLTIDLRNELLRLWPIYQKKLHTTFQTDFKNDTSAQNLNLIAQNLNLILNSPGVEEIPFDAELSSLLGCILLFIIIEEQNTTDVQSINIVQALLDPRIAHLIQPNGKCGLGRILTNAAYSSNLFYVNEILKHPQARFIISQPTNISNSLNIYGVEFVSKTHLEERWYLEQHGLTESLFAAVINDDYDYPIAIVADTQLTQVLQSIINFAQLHHVDLHVNDFCGLADTLVSAAGKNNGDQVPTILSIPASNQIMANAFNSESGGLDNALINAAPEGSLVAVQLILNHPNASQISRQQLMEAYQDAQKKNGEVAAHIQAFIDRMG